MTEPSGDQELSPELALTRPPGDPERIEFLLRIAERFVDSMTGGDYDTIRRNLEPDVKLYILQDEQGNVWGGDFEPVYEGPEGVMRAFERWSEPWEDLRLELEELIDLGETTFIVSGSWHGRGRGSGVEVNTPYQARYTLRGERIVRIEFIDLDEALRELGLER